ncbi:MAG: hypothetical protein HDR26_09770 [Lachnospiraceae bacterium]|nr:hypothetical protein [Lachnospiraceae bacterium]
MKLLFKQRFFSWFDSYDIYDEYGNTVYTVEGKLSWGHCLHILDVQGEHIGTVQEKVLTMLPKFELYMGNRYIGQVKREFSFFIPKYTLDCMGWNIEGDIMGWDYRITDSFGNGVASVEKKIWNWTDTYELSFADGGNALYILMIVLAIDAANCSNG